MGGDTYGRGVGKASSSGSFGSGGTSSASSKKDLGSTSAHSDISPYNKEVKSEKKSPIVIALDVTGSNREFSRIVYDKAPMLHGQIEQQGYLTDFDICFTAVGDAYCDSAPLQVCDFEYGIALDEQLKKLFLEGRGGGQGMETYELTAHFFNTSCDMPNAEQPFFFMIGDEAPYPHVEPHIAERVLGKSTGEPLETSAVFAELFRKFGGNVFFLQNPYEGNRQQTGATDAIRQKWIKYFGTANAEKIIPIHEEKSVVDVILGTIAMVSNARNLGTYTTDLATRGQSDTRIANVKSSLGSLERALVPVVKDAKLPAKGGKSRRSGGKRL
jgi:hypothetical protein